MNTPAITDYEFGQFQKLIYKATGIHMSPVKKPLVMGRLAKRLNHHGLSTYGEYYKLLHHCDHPLELQTAVDLLTTNETYFFREPKHFEFLQRTVLPNHSKARCLRIWSAACSSGQEPYSIAMLLSYFLGECPWEITASDISTRVLEKAQRGHYPIEQAEQIPDVLLKRYCLKGKGAQEGTFLINRKIRKRIRFSQINLIEPMPAREEFDIIFLRNVMIYFNADTKRTVLHHIIRRLKTGGYLFIGHSENLNGIYDDLTTIRPAIYHKTRGH